MLLSVTKKNSDTHTHLLVFVFHIGSVGNIYIPSPLALITDESFHGSGYTHARGKGKERKGKERKGESKRKVKAKGESKRKEKNPTPP